MARAEMTERDRLAQVHVQGLTSSTVWPCSWSVRRFLRLDQESGSADSPIAQELGCTCSSPVMASSSNCSTHHNSEKPLNFCCMQDAQLCTESVGLCARNPGPTYTRPAGGKQEQGAAKHHCQQGANCSRHTADVLNHNTSIARHGARPSTGPALNTHVWTFFGGIFGIFGFIPTRL